MKIHIQTHYFSLTDAMRNHAERKILFALASFDDHIQKVVMRLSDINGPRKGADKRCQLQILLNGLPCVVIEDIETNLYVAINRATDRAGITVNRRINRQQTILRQDRSPVWVDEIHA